MEKSIEILKSLTPNLIKTDLIESKKRKDKSNQSLFNLFIPNENDLIDNSPTSLIKGFECYKFFNNKNKLNLYKQNDKDLNRVKNFNNLNKSIILQEIKRIDEKLRTLQNFKNDLLNDLIKVEEFDLELKEKEDKKFLRFNNFNNFNDDDEIFIPDDHQYLPLNKDFMTIKASNGKVNDLSLNKPYDNLITVSDDPLVNVWNLKSGQRLGQLSGHSDSINCCQLVNNLCLTGSNDNLIKIWDLNQFNETFSLNGHTDSINKLQFNQNFLVSGSNDKTIRLWDLNTQKCLITMDVLSHINKSNFNSLSFDPFIGGLQFYLNGLVTGSADCIIRLWDMRTGQPHRNLLGHSNPISCLSFDQFNIVSGSYDGQVNVCIILLYLLDV